MWFLLCFYCEFMPQVYETVETILVYPEDCLKVINQSEETTAIDEPKRRFKKLSLNFGGKDRPFLRKPALFSRKPPKPTSTLDENDWTVVQMFLYIQCIVCGICTEHLLPIVKGIYINGKEHRQFGNEHYSPDNVLVKLFSLLWKFDVIFFPWPL